MSATPATSAGFAVRRTTGTARIALVVGVLVVAALAALPLAGNAEAMRLVVEFICVLTIAQMWNFLAGYGGIVSIGQQAFIGLGGYALVAFVNHLGVNPFLAVPLAGIVAALLAIPTSYVVFRLKGAYFAIGTWAVAESYRLILANVQLFGGGSGESLTALVAIPLAVREIVTYEMAVVLGVAAVGGVYWLVRSRLGLALTAIRDSERAAASAGVDVRRTTLTIYAIAALGAGLAGALYFLEQLRITPDAAFGMSWIPLMFFAVVIGGLGTIEGPIVGTLLYFVLRQEFSDSGAWYLVGLGVLSILVMLLAPEGLWGLVARRWNLHLFPVRRRLDVAGETGTANGELHA
ncbi:MAG TPA: branched-chain amino acid ABC transporter permease [Candidatus Sulfotelmatobacter sp.]|nr:branched-chain amino acid ABC transporter permease [Candidatus Sulfotelmatobacter sp.]